MKRFLCFLAVLLLCLGTVACGGSTGNKASKDTYYVILFNSHHLTKEDAKALAQLSSLYPSRDVLPIDVKACEDATEVYTLLQRETAKQSGTLDGIQIIGTADAVPSFLADYKLALPAGTTKGTTYFTDYFYQNLTNDPDAFADFSVADHFERGDALSFTPHHRVIRLPLGAGELSDYVACYRKYVEEMNAVTPSLVSFSSSIFRYNDVTSADDLAHFLDRAEREWGIIEGVHVYTNQVGEYLSPITSLGDITAENMQKENREGVKEFFLLGHGSSLAVVRTVFKEDGTQQQPPFLRYEDIPAVFNTNPYFLNIHACLSAEGMGDNLIRRAMQNGCLGAFATTSLIANNGIDAKAPLEDMTGGVNFFGFHYAYLAARHEGESRTAAFLTAQKAYAEALGAAAKEPIDYTANYQMGYHNLLTYTSFGIFEPEVTRFPTVPDGSLPYSDAIPAERAFVSLSSGVMADDALPLSASEAMNRGVAVTVSELTATPLDNGCIRFSVTVETSAQPVVRFIGNTGPYLADRLTSYPVLREESVLVIDLEKDAIRKDGTLALLFEKDGKSALWLVDTSPLF